MLIDCLRLRRTDPLTIHNNSSSSSSSLTLTLTLLLLLVAALQSGLSLNKIDFPPLRRLVHLLRLHSTRIDVITIIIIANDLRRLLLVRLLLRLLLGPQHLLIIVLTHRI